MPTYKGKKDGRWRYRFSRGGKRYGGSTRKGANLEKAAAALEKKHIEKLEKNIFTGDMPTVTQFSVRFLAFQKANTKQLTYDLHERIVELHIVPHIGKKSLDQVGRAGLDYLKTVWAAAPRTINTRLGVVMRMLKLAEEWEILASAPVTKLLKIPQDTPRFLNQEEALALLLAAPPQWKSMVMIGLRTGLRIGELRGLQWGDVDFARSLLHVRRTDPGRPDMDPNSPKGNRPRVVPLTPDALTCLRETLAESVWRKPAHFVWTGAASWHGQHDRYRTRSEGNCASAMGKIAAKAGLDEEVTWHTLRHTFASWLVMRGVPIPAVQELLGHALIKQTMRYAHLTPGFAQHAAVAGLDFSLAPPPALPPGDDSDD